jgi:hypothetical protein
MYSRNVQLFAVLNYVVLLGWGLGIMSRKGKLCEVLLSSCFYLFSGLRRVRDNAVKVIVIFLTVCAVFLSTLLVQIDCI